MLKKLEPGNLALAMLSFEGPDLYSMAGGLGVRAIELCRAIAEAGYETHLFFVGDPAKPGIESLCAGNLTLHRWCQWISAYHPSGVYENEEGKISDYEHSVPPFLLNHIMRSANNGKLFAVLGEEWQTVGTILKLQQQVKLNNLERQVIPFWNANNIFGFWRINWEALQKETFITTVSRYMKHYMWGLGINPLIIPNGVPARLLKLIAPTAIKKLRQIFAGNHLLVKVGRFDSDKRWIMAVKALAQLKAAGIPVKLLIRGGMEPHRWEVEATAQSLGLHWAQVKAAVLQAKDCYAPIAEHKDADIIECKFFVPEEFLRVMYASADAVLANSGHEPFGIVGLEVMAAGGIAFTGATGEDYARTFENAMVVETDDPREISAYLKELISNPELGAALRRGAKTTAVNYTWDKIVGQLINKLEFAASIKGI